MVCVCLHVLFGCVCYVRQSTCVRVAHVCMTLASSVLNARVDDITYTYRWLECHAQIHVWRASFMFVACPIHTLDAVCVYHTASKCVGCRNFFDFVWVWTGDLNAKKEDVQITVVRSSKTETVSTHDLVTIY